MGILDNPRLNGGHIGSLFFPPKHKRLAKVITIRSPKAFRGSIRTLQKGGLSLQEERALVLARNRAAAILKKKNLSSKERKQMMVITNIMIPKVSKGRRRRR